MKKQSYSGMVNINGVPLYISDAKRLFGTPKRRKDKIAGRERLLNIATNPSFGQERVYETVEVDKPEVVKRQPYYVSDSGTIAVDTSFIQPIDTAGIKKDSIYIPPILQDSVVARPDTASVKEIVITPANKSTKPNAEAKQEPKKYKGQDLYTPKDTSSFSKAFAEARANKASVFEFNGKVYTTDIKKPEVRQKMNTEYTPSGLVIKGVEVAQNRPTINTGREQRRILKEQEQFNYNMPVMKNGSKIYYQPK